MYISEILEITNYRNLTGKRIKFNETLNFLIGENNIGKGLPGFRAIAERQEDIHA